MYQLCKKYLSFVFITMVFIFFISSPVHCNSTKQKLTDHVNGIDVSAWQATINWNDVYQDDIQFAFCKATEGIGWTDPFVHINLNNASEAGVLIGPYHFATPQIDDAIAEAEYFLSVVDDYLIDGYLRPVLDLEQGASLGIEALSHWVHSWMNTIINETGIEPILYVNANYASNYLDYSVNQYDLWIAHWTYDPDLTPETGIWNDWDFWQYSDQGSINGITGNVDLNVFNEDTNDLQDYIIGSANPYIDINQAHFDRGFPIRHAADGDWAGAQSFIPTTNILTKVDLYLRKFGTPEFNLIVKLRENNPQGTIIDTILFTPAEVSHTWEWKIIDFEDVNATSSTNYFITIPPAPSGVQSSFGYEWGYAFGNQYNEGSFWFTRDGGGLWRDLPTMYEFVFKTYGYN